MKRKNSPAGLIIVGLLTFVLIGLTYFIAFSNESTDISSEAQEIKGGLISEGLENGEIIEMVIDDSSASKLVCDIRQDSINSPIYSTKYVTKDSALNRFYFTSDPILKPGQYYGQCLICADDSCTKTDPNKWYTSKYYTIENPVGSLSFDDSTFCTDGEIYPVITNTNRSWFKIVVKDYLGQIYYDFYDSAANCINLSSIRYCDMTPFTTDSSTVYSANLYYCTENCSSICTPTYPANCKCGALCTTLLDSVMLNAPACNTDLGIADVTVTDPVAQNTSYNVSATVKNYSTLSSKDSKLSLNVYDQLCDINAPFCNSLASTSFNIPSIAPGEQATRTYNFPGLGVGTYYVVANIRLIEGTDTNSFNDNGGDSFTVTDTTCNECPAGKYLKADCSCVDCLSDDHCSSVTKCNLETNTCICDLSCPTGFFVTNHCNACVCSTTCANDEYQRADCSCVSTSTAGDSEEDFANSSIDITSPKSGTKYTVGDKIILSYKFNGNFNYIQSKIKWMIGSTTYDGQNGYAYEPQKAGTSSIKVLYDGKAMDSVEITVTEADYEETATSTDETTVKDISWVVICLGAVGLIALIVSIVMLVANMLKKNKEDAYLNE